MKFYRNSIKKVQPSLTLSPISSIDSNEERQDYGIDSKIAESNKAQTLNRVSMEPVLPMDLDVRMDVDSESRDTEAREASPLLSLPLEILHRIIEIVYYDETTNSINSNLERFSKTIPLLSKSLNLISVRFLYKYAIFNRPHSFDMFLQNILHAPDLGLFVEFMDFMMFSSIGLGRTGRMNQEIQMVTSHTILKALQHTPNLLEFLATENIQDDIDSEVLNFLFNDLMKVQALDFCGASSEKFASAFRLMQVRKSEVDESQDDQVTMPVENILKLSFHDCSNLSIGVFEKLLPCLRKIRRLDLTHTSITSSVLYSGLSQDVRITHLSLARCSKLTTRDLINFLTAHGAVSEGSLRWLSLQVDSNIVTPLSENYLNFTLRHLNAPQIRYLNLGGLPVSSQTLRIIKQRFPYLESLSIAHASIETNDVIEYLHNNSIKFLDITGCKKISRWNLIQILKLCYGSSLLGIEFDYKALYEISSGQHIHISPKLGSSVNILSSAAHVEPELWKFYDNQGRRSWLYRIEKGDEEYFPANASSVKSSNMNLTLYDIETGEKIEQKYVKPTFLMYASRKINCSVGYFNLNLAKKKSYFEDPYEESIWPVEFSERGIYNYYSLNLK